MRRREIFRRDAYRCVYCGAEPGRDALTVDHVEPRVKGGDNSRGNVVTACVPCNREKGGLAAWEYLRDRPEKRERFLDRAPYVWSRLRRAIREAANGGPPAETPPR